MATVCEVCESPSANTLHFGGRTCKACAAFFRRTVSHDMNYNCVHGTSCRIHHELRMICRQCRFLKCLRAGMKREMVQARGGDRSSPKEKKSERTNSLSRTESIQSPVECIPSTSTPSNPSPSSDSFYRPPSIDSEEIEYGRTLDHFLHMEASLNDRRRIMYTDVRIRQVFNAMCECPYTRDQLRPFNYRTFQAFDRHDFIMVYDYAKALPGFDEASIADKSFIYRFCCAVDCMINSAYYSTRLGQKESLLVLFNAEYIPMDPLPPSGDEKDAESKFENKQDYIRYKSLMPTKLRQWENMTVPFFDLDITFEEFCLVKVLTIWHMSYFKLSPAGRSICCQQRDIIIRALHRFCLERGVNPAERMGSLILLMSCVMEQVHELTNSLWMITFFEICKWDTKVEEVLDQNYSDQ